MSWRCRYGHAHPPWPVLQTQYPFSGKEGKMHCFRCAKTNHMRTNPAYWLTVQDRAMMLALLGTEPLCRHCFPPDS